MHPHIPHKGTGLGRKKPLKHWAQAFGIFAEFTIFGRAITNRPYLKGGI